MPQAKKRKLLKIMKAFIISLNTAAIVSLVVVIIIDSDNIFKTGSGIDPSLSIRIHQIIFVVLMYVLLAITGCALLKQMKQYFTETPRYLVVSKYIIIMSCTVALAMQTLQMTIEEMYTPEIL